MKKTCLIFALIGAAAPYLVYYLFLFLGFPQNTGGAAYGAMAVAIGLTDGVLLWAVWKNPKLQGVQWLLTALTLAFTPACGLPLYLYYTAE